METVKAEGEENVRVNSGVRGEKLEFRMDMDEAMDQLDVPCKKVTHMESAYLLALKTKEQIEETVLKLQALTKVTWSVKQTRKFEPCVKKRPKKPITLFKRQYGCHMSTRTRARTKKLRNKRSRNINCPAQLMVSIKSYVASSRAKPKLAMFDKEFPCLFEFRNHHNHLVNVADVLTTRPMGDDIKEAICKLLNKGHSCASAYHTLYTAKVEEFGTNYQAKMTDRHHFPRRNDIATIYKIHGFREKYDRFLELSCTVKNLEELLFAYQKKNGTLYRLSVNDDTIVMCLCTPLMQRAIQQVSGVMFIDSSSDDYKEYKSYFILTQSVVGALPISCIVTNKHDMSAFREGMKLFFEMIEIQPAVVLTSGAIMAELVAQNYFPNSKILFSYYHALSSAWRSLYETRHELARTKKESYYQLFREVVFADSEEGLVVARQVLAVECAQPKFLNYIDMMYENIQLWCLYYRQYMVLHGTEPFDHNEAELSFRLFRLVSRIALDRTRLFNLSQITDFLCSAFEKYYRNRILEMVLGRKSQVLEEKYGRPGQNTSLPNMEDIGHHQYLFTKTVPEIMDEYYQVDMITLLCTCGMGAVGKHCEHVAEILAKFDVFSPPLTVEQKAASYFIATGVLRHKNSFLPERDQNLMEEHETVCSSPETVMAPEDSEMLEDGNASEALSEFEATKSKWISYCNKIIKLMEKDPSQFLPAIKVHLDNVKKYSTSVPMLLKGLYAGFPYMGDTDILPPLTIINNRPRATLAQIDHAASGRAITRGTRSLQPLINMKGEHPGPGNINASGRPPLMKSVKPGPKGAVPRKLDIIKNTSAVHSRWSSFSSASNSPVSMTIENCEEDQSSEEEDSKRGVPILQETLVQHQIQPDKNQSKSDLDMINDKSTFSDTVTLNQLSNGFGVGPGDSSEMFEIQKGIFVDQAALSQLTQNEVAVLDEKKGILIIPMPSD